MKIGMGTIINYNDELFDIDKEIKMLTFKRIMTYIIIKAIYDSEYNLALLRPNHTKIFDTDNKYFKVMVYCENYDSCYSRSFVYGGLCFCWTVAWAHIQKIPLR